MLMGNLQVIIRNHIDEMIENEDDPSIPILVDVKQNQICMYFSRMNLCLYIYIYLPRPTRTDTEEMLVLWLWKKIL